MPAPRTDLVILRPWRDGSVHAEVPTASFHDENDIVWTHAEDYEAARRTGRSFTSLCGQPYWGKASATGYGHPSRVDCPKCRSLLLGETYPGETLAMRAVADGVWDEA